MCVHSRTSVMGYKYVAVFNGLSRTHVKTIKNVDSTVEKAEFKLKIAELLEALAEAKLQAIETQEVLREKEGRIEELKNILNIKPSLVFVKDRYYQKDDNENPIGEPYCQRCWESDNKLIHIVPVGHIFKCADCKNTFGQKPNYSSDSY